MHAGRRVWQTIPSVPTEGGDDRDGEAVTGRRVGCRASWGSILLSLADVLRTSNGVWALSNTSGCQRHAALWRTWPNLSKYNSTAHGMSLKMI